MSTAKTNAMRILDSNKIDYTVIEYKTKKGEHMDGVEVAHQTGKDVNMVYKTLVAKGHSKEVYVFVIPVDKHLDLKKAAKASKEKNIEMINLNDINKVTGYVRGGCSPIGMKKHYKTFINETANDLEKIIVSGGKIGYQIELSPIDLKNITECDFVDLIQ